MEKNEPMINTITAIVTYLIRSNSDVTCLQSGTALKAVIKYVTDYVTKMSLKTHVIFDSVRAMFARNAEMIGGSATRKEKARRLMTKIVNSLSAKMEMGSPMVCMYLLGNPDHYKSHRFALFYWQSYVREARKFWHEDDPHSELMQPEKVALIKRHGRIVGLSPVYDYTYRPVELTEMCLYDWIRRCRRVKLPKGVAKKKKVNSDTIDDVENISDIDASYGTANESVDSCDTTSYQIDKKVTETAPSTTANLNGLFTLLKPHPLSDTHGTRCVSEEDALVPNFAGPILPRPDQGDREYYCSVMLALFKPWRGGEVLKSKEETWDAAFLEYNFTKRQKELMVNFNLRYECLDAKDDFQAQLRAGALNVPGWVDGQDDGATGEGLEIGGAEGDHNEAPHPEEFEYDVGPVGKHQSKRESDMAAMRSVMMLSGWMDFMPGSHVSHDISGPVGIPSKSPTMWRSEVLRLKQNILELRALHSRPDLNTGGVDKKPSGHKLEFLHQPGEVKIVDKSYLERSYCPLESMLTMEAVIQEYNLNEEQLRAFRIVANHASGAHSDQLKMYIGGMGGTGKSQVLRALIEFFKLRGESYRFAIVAPTGSAAALLGGSTYHYMLGLNEGADGKISGARLALLISRMEGVTHLFFDEVSMLSCRDLHRISARLSQIFNEAELPFGGLNIIFAGDFAQLPPVLGGEASSLYSRVVGYKSTTRYDQEAALGKAIWHQICTVVVLRENMRQRDQSQDDVKLRQALSNMRYKACAPEDLAFLRSRISANIQGRPSVKEGVFRNVSIITALNVHKDEINRLGSIRFSEESGQPLIDFYSEDSLGAPPEKDVSKRRKKATNRSPAISDNLQNLLWGQPHCANVKHIPGKLSLCLGMPVMIRVNSATELCITRGQEGWVSGWEAEVGSRGQNLLGVLFVKLKNPPQLIQFDGLPENVVPLVRTSTSTLCHLPDDSTICITRSQVEVLPNFAMTDYASQGKTRAYNVVDLNNCYTHQSYYTALSRSASAAGTLILQGFDARKITGGASGALRQEFRELELLDEISRLTYEGRLPPAVTGDRRNTLIAAYQSLKGEDYMPATMHNAISWSESDPYLIMEPTLPLVRQKQDPKDEITILPPRDATTHSTVRLRPQKRNVSGSAVQQHLEGPKKIQSAHPVGVVENLHQGVPLGTVWRANSCAYDAIVSILYNIWCDSPTIRTEMFHRLNAELMGLLANGFTNHANGTYTLEDTRDYFRRALHQSAPERFVWGEFASVHSIMDHVLRVHEPMLSSKLECPNGHPVARNAQSLLNNCMINATVTHQNKDSNGGFCTNTASTCIACGAMLQRKFSYVQAPPLLAFDVAGCSEHGLEDRISICIGDQRWLYTLRGVIYHGHAHFTARIISSDGVVWYHDGMQTRSPVVWEGDRSVLLDMYTCRSRLAIMAVYVRNPSN